MDAQRSDEWFAKRLGKITGTAFSDVMNFTAKGEAGAGRKNLITRLAVERITKQNTESYQNAAMRRGVELEPIARSAYEAKTGELVDEIDFIHHQKHDFIGISPDGLIDKSGMVEIKCPESMHKHLAALTSGAHYQEYKWQVQGQLWCAERDFNDVVSYDPRFPSNLQLAIIRVNRDDSAIEKLESECLKVEEEILSVIKQLNKLRGNLC